LDDYIYYYEDGTLRKCQLDEHGNRLRDAEGNLKTLRHKFAVYCDDICAGADNLEELYELFEALICCCKRAGIQVKASKTKFGMDRITFHNYTISCEGTRPKDANLCPIRNMSSLSDVSQVRAFLGCCQQMSQYIKEYGIMAAPLHGLTKKARAFPKPWIKLLVIREQIRDRCSWGRRNCSLCKVPRSASGTVRNSRPAYPFVWMRWRILATPQNECGAGSSPARRIFHHDVLGTGRSRNVNRPQNKRRSKHLNPNHRTLHHVRAGRGRPREKGVGDSPTMVESQPHRANKQRHGRIDPQ
jgi:hypothetical protein